MNPELIFIVMAIAGGGLFALGGTTWKPWRRYASPVALGVCLYTLGIDLGHIALSMGLLCAVLHLPYGDSVTDVGRFFVFCTYGLPCLFIAPVGVLVRGNGWVLFLPIVVWLLAQASRSKVLERVVFHKVWEFVTGVLVAASLYAGVS